MNENLKFFDAFYFIVITATTIGYGDIYPLKTESRLIVSVMIVIIFVIFGDQISKILEIMKESDKYDIRYSLKSHTIVFNNKSISVLTSFLINHFTTVEEGSKVLIVDDVSMTEKFNRLGKDLFKGRILFLTTRFGVTTRILIKSWASEAKHIFVLSDPFSGNGDEQDKQALFLKSFLRNNGIECPIYLQFSIYDDRYLENFITIINYQEDER